MGIIRIVIGTAMMSVAVTSYFDEMEVVTGGLTGIAIIVRYISGGLIPIWVTNLVINIPLFIAGIKLLNKKEMINTFIGTVFLTFFLGAIPTFNILTNDTLVNIVAGSTLMGAGLGLIFSANASSGGTDLLAILIRKKVKHISIAKILAILDAVIVAVGGLAFGIVKVIYAIIAIFIITKVADYVTEGPSRATLMQIISNKNEEIAKYIMSEIERGVSSICIKGMYTGESRTMLICVVTPKEIAKIKEFIYKNDKNAMCFIGEIREVFGEGFTKNQL